MQYPSGVTTSIYLILDYNNKLQPKKANGQNIYCCTDRGPPEVAPEYNTDYSYAHSHIA